MKLGILLILSNLEREREREREREELNNANKIQNRHIDTKTYLKKNIFQICFFYTSYSHD